MVSFIRRSRRSRATKKYNINKFWLHFVQLELSFVFLFCVYITCIVYIV